MELSQEQKAAIFDNTFNCVDRRIACQQFRPCKPSHAIQWSTCTASQSWSFAACQRQHFSPHRSRQFRAPKFAPDARRNRLRDLVQRVCTASVLYLPRTVTDNIALCSSYVPHVLIVRRKSEPRCREIYGTEFCFSNARAPARRLEEERQGGWCVRA